MGRISYQNQYVNINGKLFSDVVNAKFSDRDSGVVAGKIKDNKRKVYLSRYLKVVEIMDDSDVAKLYKKTLGDSGISVPFNVVTPSLRSELEKIGVKIDYNGTPMYQSLQSRKANNNGAKYSIREIVGESGKNYGKGVYLDSTFLDNLSDSERIDLIKEYVRELAHKELSAFDKNGNEYLITVLGSEKYLAENGKRIHANSDFRKKHINNKTKQEAIALIDEVVISSKIVNDSEEAKHSHDWIDNNGKNKWSSLHTYDVDKSGDIWSAVLSISKGTDGKNYLYDLSTKKEGERVSKFTTEPLLDKKISQNESDVNSKYFDRDSEGNTLTKAQQEYFKESKVRDENGNLLVMHHGTGAEFTEFDRNFIGKTGAFEGAGFNFTPSEGRAKSFGGRVMSGYINVTRPLSANSVTMNARSLANLIEKIDPTGDDIIANYAGDTRDYGKPSFVKREALTTARAVLENAENDVDVYSDLSAGSGGDIYQCIIDSIR